MSNSGEETELFALFDGFMNICFQGTEGSQQQVSEQKQSQQSQSNLTQPWSAHWKQFKIIISQRPINYHQFFTFISKIQENTSPSIVVSQQDTDSLSESSNQPSQLKNQQKAINPRTSAGPSIASSQNIFSFQSPVNNNINQHSGLINKASNNEAFLGTNIGMFKTAGGNLQSNMIKNNNNKKTNPATIQTQNTQNDINNHLLMSQKDHNIVNGQDPERKEGRINKENQSNQMNNLNGKPIVTDEQVESRNNNNTEKNTFNIYNTDISEQQSSQQQFQSQTSQQSPDKPSKKPSVLASHKSPQQQQPHPQSLHQSQNSTQNPRSGTQPPQNSINFTNYTNNQAKLISNNLRQVDSTGISQASTFVSSEKNTLFYLRNFSEFLRANTTIQSLGKNTQFENTSIVCLSNTTNSYLKLISINFFINLFKELPHPELSPNLTCQNSKHFLLEIINNVQSGSLILYLPHNSVLSIQQVTHAFISNIGLLLQLYFLYGQHPYKLATALIFQINNDPILLDSLISVVRALLLQQVHRSSNEIILSFFKIPDSAKKDPKINIDQILQEEKKQIIKRMKLQENWRIVNNEWLFLLSFALKRYIELFTLWENQLEQIIFAQLKLSEVATRNKINLFSTTPMDQKYQVTYLLLNNQQDKQIYATIAGTTMDKHGLRLDEEFNLKYVMKQIAKELDCKFPGKEQINSPVSVGGQDQVRSQIEKPKQPGVVINSNHHNQVQSEHQIGLDNINEGLIQSQQAYVSQGQQQQQNNNNNNNNNRKPHTQTTLSSDQANKDYQTGHRIRQPGAQGNQQINQFQQQQQARMEASGRLSHGVKLQNPVQQQQQQPASQLNGLASPQIQKGTTATSPRIEGVGAPQRVSINNREDNIDWNKPALQTKLKDLLFTLNIHSEQLNSLGKFFISSAITNQQQPQQIHTQPNKQNEIPPFTKDMNQPVSSPMKLKSILNPLQPVEDNNIHNNNNNSNNNNSKHNNNNNTNSHNNTNNTQSSHGLSQASTKYASTLGSQPSNGLQQTNNMNSQIPNTTGIQGPQQNKQSFQQYQQQQQLQQQHQQLYSSNQYSNSQNERFKMFRSTNNNNTTSENNSQSNGYASNYHGGLGGMHASQNSNNISNQLNSNGGLFQQQQQYHSAFQNNQNINNLNGNGSINGQGNNAFKRPNSIEGTSKQQQQQQQQQQMYQQQQSQPMYSNQAQQYQQREITTKLSPRQQNNYNNNNNNNINPVSH